MKRLVTLGDAYLQLTRLRELTGSPEAISELFESHEIDAEGMRKASIANLAAQMGYTPDDVDDEGLPADESERNALLMGAAFFSQGACFALVLTDANANGGR